MSAVLRTVVAMVVGLAIALALVIAVEFFSAVVHPFPAGFRGTQEEMCRHVENYPAWVLAVVVPAWAATALVSTWAARSIGNRHAAATVGLLLLAAVAVNISMLPYPARFKVASALFVFSAVAFGVGRRSAKLSDKKS